MNNVLDTLNSICCCPFCKGVLRNVPIKIAGAYVKEGYTYCDNCNKQVGSIRQYKYCFRNYDICLNDKKAQSEPIKEYRQIRIDYDNPLIKFDQNWVDYQEQSKFSDVIGASFKFFGHFGAVKLFFTNHHWSGIISVYIDNNFFGEYDLYKDVSKSGVYPSFDSGNITYGYHNVEVIISDNRNSKSLSNQVFLHTVEYCTDEEITPGIPSNRKIGNSGGGFPDLVLDEIKKLPNTALILDAGGGKRQLGDERYINFDYMDQEGYPDIYGDGHYLPFFDNSFDFIISQGVLEHTYNPFQIANELYRVLKPEGKIYVDTAFIQPYHGVPHHYFNFTISGLREVFKEFIHITSDYLGTLEDICSWYFRDINLANNISDEKYENLMNSIVDVDRCTTKAQKDLFAPVVYFLGKKG